MNTTAFIFSLANAIAAIAWLWLVIAPNARFSKKVIRSGIYPLLFAAAYLVFLVISIIRNGQSPDFGSIEGITAIFSSDWGALTGWMHYLCFDMLIGIHILKVCQQRKTATLSRILFLCFTFMLGPVGWGLFYLSTSRRR